MKEIKAYIRRDKFEAVSHALHQIEGLTGMSAISVHGFGDKMLKAERQDVENELEVLASHIKIEIVCRDEIVDEVVTVIQETANTGLPGDGRIYVSSVEDAVRIATDERGESAV